MLFNTIIRLLWAFTIFVMLGSIHSAWAQDASTNKISSLCKPADIQNLACEDTRDCAFKVRASINDFFEAYQAPKPTVAQKLRYPQKCLYRSYKDEIVNLTYNVLPNGKPVNVKVLNSSNDCFNKSARNSVRTLKFEKSADGYLCVPRTLSYSRQSLSDASGNSY